MNPAALPFDTDSMLAGLRPWVECESPTWNRSAVNRVLDLATRDMVLMGARVERIPGRMEFGDCVRGTFPHPRAGDPGILILGHMDTVHPVGTLAALPWRREGTRCYGPGIFDMKGGNFISLEALRQLAAAGFTTPLPVTMLLTSDEEVGSPSSRDVIEAEAKRHRLVLVPEPARADGGVVVGRYAIARFDLEAVGRPSHAGSSLSSGRSAIHEMSRRILDIEAMTGEDCTFSVGVVHGGQWANCVSATCMGEALSMAKRQEDLDNGVARMMELCGTRDDVTFTVRRGVTRPVWTTNEAVNALHARAEEIAQGLGFAIPPQYAGGGSDGNFTGALGIPTLDGLGLRGGGAHTLGEYIEVESLAERGRLMAGLVATVDG